MSYADFTVDTVEHRLGVRMQSGQLFPRLAAANIPAWLPEVLSRGRNNYLANEKARSEFLVTPVLLAATSVTPTPTTIYSGQRLDIDPVRGLVGECDFIIGGTAGPLPVVRSPLLTVVEAKKQDLESGLGQCIAQTVGAAEFNNNNNDPPHPVFGCVTTGEVWQFLRLDDLRVTVDDRRFFIDCLPELLGALSAVMSAPASQ